jgi:transcriptional regulator with XRE-family HTH domain
MALGKRVLQLRTGRDWTQQRVCDLANELIGADGTALTQQNLDNLEKRDSKTAEAAPFLAEVFGVSLRWLLSGRGNPADTDWPFPRVKRERWDACGPEDRAYVQAAINRALDDCEGQRGEPSANHKAA